MRLEDLEARRRLIDSQPAIQPGDEGYKLRRSESGGLRMDHEQGFPVGIAEKFTHETHDLTVRHEGIIRIEWQHLEEPRQSRRGAAAAYGALTV